MKTVLEKLIYSSTSSLGSSHMNIKSMYYRY